MAKLVDLAKPYCVKGGAKYRLRDFDPTDTGPFRSKDRAIRALELGLAQLRDLQNKLYSQEHWAVLLIFQGMDASGKDGVIAHVMSGVNPQGCQVYSFKAPSGEELSHDYLWRAVIRLPERRRIGIFNRSYYEEVLVVRVHPNLLENEKIPPSLITPEIWKERFEDIRGFERYLTRNGIAVRKFFLHISKHEQVKRFLERLQQPEKNWKLSASDLHEREHWDEYMKAYEDVVRNTATDAAPWYVVPADHKWFARVIVASAVVGTLAQLALDFPALNQQRRAELDEIRKILELELQE